METRTLTFNLLTFSHAKSHLTFHFYASPANGLQRVHHGAVPQEVIEHFGQQEHYYTSYEMAFDNALAVTKDTSPTFQIVITENGEPRREMIPNKCFTRALLKRYYSIHIGHYFESRDAIVKQNYVDDVEVWLPHAEKKPTPEYNFFEKYSIRVQFSTVTDKPELMLIYEGWSKVFKESALSLMKRVDNSAIIWAIHGNKLFHYQHRPPGIDRVLDQVFPVWNFELREQLNQKPEKPEKGNKYLSFDKYLNTFVDTHLKTEGFRKILPLDSFDFLTVPEERIGEVDANAKTLIFGHDKEGNPFRSSLPKIGIQEAGPFEINLPKVQFFFIVHKDDVDLAQKFISYMNGDTSPKGIYDYVNIPFNTKPGFSITFQNKFNPIPKLERKIRDRDRSGLFDPDTHYLPVYISPFGKNVKNQKCKLIYYHMKELLLKFGLPCQVAESYKLRNDEKYYLKILNMSVAMLSKLGGTPWKLDTKLKNELVIGVGAFKHRDTNAQFIGSAISFTNTGKFNRFKCFRNRQTAQLAGSIIDAIMDYSSVTKLNRLVIHFYKNMSRKELNPIEEALRKLKLDIPVFIVTVHKTESSDLVAFDHSWANLMPESGTFINIGRNKYLLFNNSRYDGQEFDEFEGYPFPIKIGLSCNRGELLDNFITKKELIQQVYQFSRLYWKSVRQQNLPITIKYPEIVAEMFPYFRGNEIPPFGTDKLWFL